MKKTNYIKEPNKGIYHPAWKADDGTMVSIWDGLPMLLIKDDLGIRWIDHETAKELKYESKY